MTSEVTSKTCQNDFKLHTCGWFWMIFENNQSDPPKEVRGQISSQTIHLQKNITESNCRHQIEFWKSRRVSITANSGKKLAKTKNLENNTITQQILDWPYFLHLVKIWGIWPKYKLATFLWIRCMHIESCVTWMKISLSETYRPYKTDDILSSQKSKSKSHQPTHNLNFNCKAVYSIDIEYWVVI